MTLDQLMLPCLNKAMFGIDCPGCGAQRALFMVFRGDFKSAFHLYPAIYSLILLGIVLIVSRFYRIHPRLIHVLIGVNVLTIVISYIVKMNQIL